MGIILPTKKVYSRIREYKTGEVEVELSTRYLLYSPNGFHVATWDSV